MSDTAFEWRRTGKEIAIPRRKARFPAYDIFPIDHDALAKKVRVLSMHVDYDILSSRVASTQNLASEYPAWLLQTFAVGVIIFVIGLVSLLAVAFSAKEGLKLVGAVFLALGSLTVVLALLRGQDLDERNS
jgi:hypothetical protein